MSTLEEPDRCNTDREGSSARLPPPPFVTSQGYLVRARLEGDIAMILSMDAAKYDVATRRFRHCGRFSKKMTSSSSDTTSIGDEVSSSGEKFDCFTPGSFIQCAAEVVCWSLDSKRVCVLITRGVGKTDDGIAMSPMLATMAYGDPSTVESIMPVLGPKEWNWEKAEGSKWAIVDGPTLLCLGGKGNDWAAVSFSRLRGGDESWIIKKADSSLITLRPTQDDGEQPLNPFRRETHATMLGTGDEPVLVCCSKRDKIGVGLPGVPHFPWFEICIKENQSPTWQPWRIPAQGATALVYCPFSNGRILYMAVDTRLMIVEDGLLTSVISLPAAVKSILPLPSEKSSATSGLAVLLADESCTSIILPLPLPLSVSLSQVYLERGEVGAALSSPSHDCQGYWTPYLGVGAIVVGDFARCGRWKLAMLPVPLNAPFKPILKNTAILSASVLSSCVIGHELERKAGFPYERNVELRRAEKKTKCCSGTKRKRSTEIEGKKCGESGFDGKQTLEQLRQLNKVLMHRLLMEEEQLEQDKCIHRFRKSLLKACQGTIFKLTEGDGNEGNTKACNTRRSDLKCVYKLDTLEKEEKQQHNGTKGGVRAVRGGMKKIKVEVELLGKHFHAASRLLIVAARVLNQSCSNTMEQAYLSLSSEHSILSSHSTVISRLPPGESVVLSTEAQILPGAFASTRNCIKRRDCELYIPVSFHWTNGGNSHDAIRLCDIINISSSELLGLKAQPLERSVMLLGCQKEVVLLVESEFVDLSHLSQSIKELSSTPIRDSLIIWGAVSIENVSRRRVNIRLVLRDGTYLGPLLMAVTKTLPDGVKLSVDSEALTVPIRIAFCSALREEIELINGNLRCTDMERFVALTMLTDSHAINVFSQTNYFAE